jgi:hypothetical protein
MSMHGGLTSGVAVGVAVLCGLSLSASGQTPPVVSVGLIQQDSSDCVNSTVKDDPNRTRGGKIWATRNANGTTNVRIGMTATPNTTYHFNLKCVRKLGDIVTDDDGIGLASFDFQTSSVGSSYSFDMYPDGAATGNKFQSVTVSFP